MKKFLLAAALCLVASAAYAQSCVKVQGWAQQGGQQIVTAGSSSTTRAQKSYRSSTVTVYRPSGSLTLASIFSNSACSAAKSNPFTASSSDASYSFYISPGTIDLHFSGTGITTPFTISDVIVPINTGGGGGGGTITGVTAGTGMTGGGTTGSVTLNVVAGAGITVNADDVALTIPGTLTATTPNAAAGSHTHAITSSSNPGAAVSLLATDASGFTTLVQLNTDTIADRSGGNLTISPTGDLILDPVGNDTLPNLNYDINLGALSKKYLSLHAAELWVETLVAQNTIATIGGRILVGPTTILTADLAPASTTISVKHNQMVSGDRVYLEADSKVEFMAITSAPSGVGPYTYTVTRNLDGTGANQWYAGDAMFNTGTTGNGFIDLYSVRGVKSASEAGPTIVGNIRNSATYNDWTPRWAIGNLNGLYGYGTNEYGVALGVPTAANILIDPTNGIRLRQSSANRISLTAAGVLTINDSGGAAVITLDASTGAEITKKLTMPGVNSAISIGATPPTSATVGTGLWLDRNGLYGLNANVQQAIFDATTGKITAGAGKVTLDSTGLKIQAGDVYADQSALRFVSSGGSTLSAVYHTDFGTSQTTYIWPSTTGSVSLNLWATGTTASRIQIAAIANATSMRQYMYGLQDGFLITHADVGSTRTLAHPLEVVKYVSGNDASMSTGMMLGKEPQGTAGIGTGVSLDFTLKSTTTSYRDAARLGSLWGTVTDATRSSWLVAQTVQQGGALTERMRIGGTRAAGYDVGFGTTDPVFNDDWSTGANVGVHFAIDGTTSGYAAYLGLGGTIPGVSDRVGAVNFYNKSMGGVDNRTAVIFSFNDGTLGRGNLILSTSPDNNGPIDRIKIAYDGTIRMGNTNTSGGTLAVSTLSGGAQTQQWFSSAGTLTGSFTNLGNLVIGNVNQPSTGGTPVLVLAEASGNPTAIAGNSAGLVAKDVAGTTELFAFDDAGNVTQISPHAMDGPEWLYDDDDPLPQVLKEENIYLGIIRWTNKSRQARLVERMLAGENIAALPEQQRTFIHIERYTPSGEWDVNQEKQRVSREEERRRWRELPDSEKARKPEPQPHVKKSKPEWLRRREQ